MISTELQGWGADEGAEVRVTHDVGLLGFAVLSGGRGGEAGEQPHDGKGNPGSETGGGLGDEAATGGREHAEYSRG